MGSGAPPLLIVAPPGSLPLECAREIHTNAGGDNFERVTCSPDSSEFRFQLFGPSRSPELDFSDLDLDAPDGAIQRAIGGTLILGDLDRCNQSDVGLLRSLFAREPVFHNGNPVELDSSTRVIATVTTNWAEQSQHSVPQRLTALFNDRILILDPLRGKPENVATAIDWFSWQAAPEGQHLDHLWSDDAKQMLLGHQWPGSLAEIGKFVRSLSVSVGNRGPISFDDCRDRLASYESPGMKSLDDHWRQQCHDYARGLHFMGRTIGAEDIYRWVEQFSKVSTNRTFDPWLVGLRLAREISYEYYYSADDLRKLTRTAYTSLCEELAENGLLQGSSRLDSDGPLPGLRALLFNPLGPAKSSAGLGPHMLHLLGTRNFRQATTVSDVARLLGRDERVQAILFCDEFTGTGNQILQQLVRTLGGDTNLRKVCQDRRLSGRPLVLGVVLAVGFSDALTRIRNSAPSWLPIFVHAGRVLEEGDRAFSKTSKIFPEHELRAWAKTLVVRQVGASLYPESPGGYGNLQALVVTADNTPNNSLPAVWKSGVVNGSAWKALFERVSSLAR